MITSPDLTKKDPSINRYGYTIHYLDKIFLDNSLDKIFNQERYSFETNKPDPLIIDGGSNIGLSILYFKKKYPNSRVLGFEPDPNSFRVLERNIGDNKLTGVKLFNLALSDNAGIKNFYGYIHSPNPVTLGNSLMESWGKRVETDEIDVKTVKLSDYLNEPVDFLKLNIEGSEKQVMKDLFESGKISLIKEIFLQYHQTKFENTDKELEEIVLALKREGFEVEQKAKKLGDYLQLDLRHWINSVNPSHTNLRCKRV